MHWQAPRATLANFIYPPQRQMEPLSTTSSYTQFNKLIPLGIPGWSQESENKEVADMFSSKHALIR